MSVYDEPKIDCHMHVFDATRFPYRPDTPYRPAGQEIGTPAQLVQMLDAYGVNHALVVQPNSGYFTDNSCMLDTLARHPQRFKGTAVVTSDTESPELERLKSTGILGVAINTPMFGVDYYRDIGDLVARLCDLDLFLQIQIQRDDLLSLLPSLERSPVRLLIDHCGRPAPEEGLHQPGFRELLDLGRAHRGTGRITVKLAGIGTFSQLPFPHADTWPYIHALAEAFTLDACVWGSNWPFLRAPERVDYGPLLKQAATLFPNPADRRKLFWDTPRRVFGFSS